MLSPGYSISLFCCAGDVQDRHSTEDGLRTNRLCSKAVVFLGQPHSLAEVRLFV